MPYVHIVIALALLEFFLFGVAVARARATYRVMAPATAGHEVFERYFRVQMNTLEQLVIFVPSILMFGVYVNAWLAAALGLTFIVGRAVYFVGYVRAAEGRHIGFVLSAVPNLVLLGGGLAGAAWWLLRA
ncbi:MAG TPA: MAPEG family protein [Steroidobacteraceae bacterium]|jgi:glutathione S-transferase|nr:MAPEG family protein [Steroidobacteraceae bacterium]